MKLLWLLIGPTLLLVVGLIVLQNIIITFLLFYGWLFLVPFLQGSSWWKKGERHYHVLIGASTGLICMLVIIGTSLFFQDTIFDIQHLQEQLKAWHFTGKKVLILLFILIFINPLLEEWYWREFVYEKLIQKMKVSHTILITSFFYALYHYFLVIYLFTFPYSIVAFIGVLLAGLLWGFIRYYYQSIYPTIISHCLADIGIIVVYVLVVLGGGLTS